MRLTLSQQGQGWADDERWRTVVGRKDREDELDRLISGWTRGWDGAELMRSLQRTGVPAGMVNDCRDLFEDPQLNYRGHFQYLDHPEIGTYATDRSEFDLSRTPGRLHRPAPLLGQHTEEVLKRFFGLSDDEYRSLSEDSVLR